MRPHTALPPALVAGLLVTALAGCTSSPAATTATTTAATSSPADVQQLQRAYETIVARVPPSVVQIDTATGLGSGVVYDTKGDIVTDAHVVGNATTFQVSLATGGAPLRGTLVGSYPASDLAVIRVTDPTAVHPAVFGDSTKVRVGQLVLAMGNPLGLSASVTDGIVSAVGRTVGEPAGGDSPGATITDAVQTSAAINPGNSGGALVDMSGNVIGIPTLAAVDPELGNAAAGIGFAIPAATATKIADQLIATGSVSNPNRAALDITARDVLDSNLQPAGVAVVSVVAGGAAAQAGIQAASVITGVDGTSTPTTSALNQVLATAKPGQRVPVDLVGRTGRRAPCRSRSAPWAPGEVAGSRLPDRVRRAGRRSAGPAGAPRRRPGQGAGRLLQLLHHREQHPRRAGAGLGRDSRPGVRPGARCGRRVPAITGVVYAVLLADVPGQHIEPWVNTVVHQVMPIVVVADWLLVPPATGYHGVAVAGVPVVYLAYSLVRGRSPLVPVSVPGSTGQRLRARRRQRRGYCCRVRRGDLAGAVGGRQAGARV